MLLGLLPWTVVELILRIVILLLEGVPVEMRRATAIQWFWTWWPLGKRLLKKEYQGEVEAAMKGTDGPAQPNGQ